MHGLTVDGWYAVDRKVVEENMNTKQALSLSLAALMVLSVVAFAAASVGVATATKTPKEIKPKLNTPQIGNPYSGSSLATPVAIVPNQPLGLSWDPVAGATGYEIGFEQQTDANTWTTVGAGTIPTSDTSFNAAMFPDYYLGDTFRCHVLATDGNRLSAWSAYGYVTVVAAGLDTATLVSPPDQSNVKAGEPLTFTWGSVTDADKYAIAIVTMPLDQTTFSITGPIPLGNKLEYTPTTSFASGTIVGWQIMAMDSDSEKISWSAYSLFAPIDKLAPPEITSPKDGANLKPGQYVFTWDDVFWMYNYQYKITITPPDESPTVIGPTVTYSTDVALPLDTYPRGTTAELSVRVLAKTADPLTSPMSSDWSTIEVTVK